MDQMMVDVTDIPGAQAGDEVVLLAVKGDERIDAGRDGRVAGYHQL